MIDLQQIAADLETIKPFKGISDTDPVKRAAWERLFNAYNAEGRNRPLTMNCAPCYGTLNAYFTGFLRTAIKKQTEKE